MSTKKAILYTNYHGEAALPVAETKGSAPRRSHAQSKMTKHEIPQKSPQQARGGRAEAIYRGIFEAVVEHRLPPGAKLAEEQLGAIYGASRTIVRSALQALAHDHIVTIARHRGAFVSAPTIADAQDVFFSRKLLESAIAREAAQRIKPADVTRLRRILAQESEALRRGDRQKAISLSGGFHIAIAAICGEGALTQFLRSLISRSSLVIALYGRGPASECGHDEHVALVSALAAGDGERAAAAMGEHLDHIVADLTLAEREAEPVDLAAILRA
ncbi:MAG: GntR family transcriptional regulator [Bradyrhizobium sp.]|nr:MAG: GntR family transcriptional regulator [Bradyrhizobium sp.]